MKQMNWDMNLNLLHRESFNWINSLRELGVPVTALLDYAKVVEGAYERLRQENTGLNIKALYRMVTGGVFAGVQPVFRIKGLDEVHLSPEMSRKEIAEAVGHGVSVLVSEAPQMFDRAERALVTHEAVVSEAKSAMAQLQDLLAQQQQVLQKHYPVSGVESLSTEILGTRVMQEELLDGALPKIYDGLDELVAAIRGSGLWLSALDGLIHTPMSLSQTRELAHEIRDMLGALDDTEYAGLKRLYSSRWVTLDGRLLSRLETKFSWMPKMQQRVLA